MLERGIDLFDVRAMIASGAVFGTSLDERGEVWIVRKTLSGSGGPVLTLAVVAEPNVAEITVVMAYWV